MIKLLRYLFGLKGVTGNRKVVGTPDNIDVKDLPYIKESNRRLAALNELHSRYINTPYAQKLKSVYDKTKRIHTYLVLRSRGHELELFHLQHTDHFLNTFTVIIDTYQLHQEEASAPSKPALKPDAGDRNVASAPRQSDSREVKAVQMKNRETSKKIFVDIVQSKTVVSKLAVPDISIDTYSRIIYLREGLSDGVTTCEIGYTSAPEEKEAFVSYVSDKLGIEGITYVGNTMVYVPGQNNSQPAEMVPVINWNGCPYVLILENDRLFPVSTFRKNR